MKRKMNTDRKSIIESYRKRFEKAIQNKDAKRIMSLRSKCAFEILRNEFGNIYYQTDVLEVITTIDHEFISHETDLMILDYNYHKELRKAEIRCWFIRFKRKIKTMIGMPLATHF